MERPGAYERSIKYLIKCTVQHMNMSLEVMIDINLIIHLPILRGRYGRHVGWEVHCLCLWFVPRLLHQTVLLPWNNHIFQPLGQCRHRTLNSANIQDIRLTPRGYVLQPGASQPYHPTPPLHGQTLPFIHYYEAVKFGLWQKNCASA